MGTDLKVAGTGSERRNLVMASLGFILYFAAGGHLVEDKVTISMLNISFERTWVLCVFAWVMLFWFKWRYWQAYNRKSSPAFLDDIYETAKECERKLIIPFIEREIEMKLNAPNGFDYLELHMIGWRWEFSLLDLKPFYGPGATRRTNRTTEEHAFTLKPSGLRFKILKLRITLLAMFRREAFVTHLFPSTLSTTAIVCGVFSLLPLVHECLF